MNAFRLSLTRLKFVCFFVSRFSRVHKHVELTILDERRRRGGGNGAARGQGAQGHTRCLHVSGVRGCTEQVKQSVSFHSDVE